MPVDDVDGFAQALRTVLTDDATRHTMSRLSAQAGRQLNSWDETVEIVGRVLDKTLLKSSP